MSTVSTGDWEVTSSGAGEGASVASTTIVRVAAGWRARGFARRHANAKGYIIDSYRICVRKAVSLTNSVHHMEMFAQASASSAGEISNRMAENFSDDRQK